jgi:hypothetical protein
MMGAMVVDSAEGELWLATRWKSTGGDEERWKVCGFEGWGVEEAENICRTEGECGDEPSEEMRPKELPFVPQGGQGRDFRHRNKTARLVGDGGWRSRLMLLDEYRTRQGKLLKD